MPTVKFDISEADEVAKHLGISINKVANRAILSLAMRIVQHITTVVIPRETPQPVDRGAFRAGWRAKKDPDGAIVKNTLPYAAIIEYGARAENIKVGRKMIEALTAWVLRKGIGSGAKMSKVDRRKEAEGIAWAIAYAMMKKGIFNRGDERGGLRVLEKALKIAKTVFSEELRREIEREYR